MERPVYPEDHAWVGRIEKVTPLEYARIGSFHPIAYLGSEHGSWRPVASSELPGLFPDRGRVFWSDVPSGVQEGDLIRVQLLRSHSYSPGREQFQVDQDHWKFAHEIVDLRSWEDERAIRLTLTGEGLNFTLITGHIFVRLEDGVSVGPLALEKTAEGRWRLPDTAQEHVEMRSLRDSHFSSIQVAATDVSIIHDMHALGDPIGLRNWLPDQKLAAGLLRRLRKLDRDAAKAIDVTDTVFRKYVEAYDDFLFQTDLQHQQEAARFERVEELRDVVLADVNLLRQCADALLANPAVQEALEEPKQRAVDEVRRAAERNIQEKIAGLEAKLSETKQQLNELYTQRSEADNELATLNEKLDNRRQEVEEEIAAIESAMEERLGEIAARPAKLFAEAAVMRSLFSVPRNDPTPVGESIDDADHDQFDAAETLTNAKQAVSKLTSALLDRGFNALDGAKMTAAFATGRGLIVAGESAYQMLTTFADSFTGGRVTWIPIAPTISDATQLLGSYDSTSGQFTQHPGGLLDVLLAANEDDMLHLVILDGYDRAPTEYYLSPILQCVADAELEHGSRTLPFVGDSGVRHRISWPANVLLACVPEQGTATIAPSPKVWQYAVLFDTDGTRAEPFESSRVVGNTYRLTSGAWKELRRSDASYDAIRSVINAVPNGSSIAAATAAKLYAGATELGISHDEAATLSFVGAVLPQIRDLAEMKRAAESALSRCPEPLLARFDNLIEYVHPVL